MHVEHVELAGVRLGHAGEVGRVFAVEVVFVEYARCAGK